MSAMQSEVYEAFRDMGAAEDKALKAVTDIKLDIAAVKGEQIVHRWMLGFILATNVAVIFKLFSH